MHGLSENRNKSVFPASVCPVKNANVKERMVFYHFNQRLRNCSAVVRQKKQKKVVQILKKKKIQKKEKISAVKIFDN